MAHDADRRLVCHEVHVQRHGRWVIEFAVADAELAGERARQYLQRADVEAVKVWKELHDPATGQSAGRVVFAEAKPRPRPRWRFARWTGEAADEAEPDAEPRPRRKVAPRPSLSADWPVVALSIGGGCAALVAMAVLAALA